MLPRGYLASLLALSALGLGWVMALNVAVDPDGVLTALELKRVDRSGEAEIVGSKGWYPVLSADRPGKALNIRWYKPDVVAFGSSNIATYFDTAHPVLKRWSERPAYNFGLPGLTAFELEDALRHATALRRPRLAIVALEFYMFGARRWKDAPWTLDRFPMAYRPTYRSELVKLAMPKILSWSGPIAKIKEAIRHVSAHELEAGTASRSKLRDIDRTQIPALYQPGTPYTFLDDNGRSSIDALRRVIAFAQQNGIELRMMVSPHHVRQYEIVRALGLWPLYEQWLRELAAAADAANASATCEQWIEILNFGEYQPLNIDLNFRAATGRGVFEHFDDSYHYSSEISSVLFGELLTREPCAPASGRGIALSRDTVEAHIAETAERRRGFALAHPAEVADVTALIAGLIPH